jgi:hypothetical protein
MQCVPPTVVALHSPSLSGVTLALFRQLRAAPVAQRTMRSEIAFMRAAQILCKIKVPSVLFLVRRSFS